LAGVMMQCEDGSSMDCPCPNDSIAEHKPTLIVTNIKHLVDVLS